MERISVSIANQSLSLNRRRHLGLGLQSISQGGCHSAGNPVINLAAEAAVASWPIACPVNSWDSDSVFNSVRLSVP
ncbi:hypothetical protein ACLKA7_016647 [Drosophila subpalustris]